MKFEDARTVVELSALFMVVLPTFLFLLLSLNTNKKD